MMETFAAVILIPVLCLLAMACVPSKFADSRAKLVRQFVTWLVGLQLVFALSLAVAHAAFGSAAHSTSIVDWEPASGLSLSVYYDGATARVGSQQLPDSTRETARDATCGSPAPRLRAI